MFTRPDDLTDDDIVDALAAGWAVPVRSLEYAPVGFGSHHWRVEGTAQRWFVTVDDLDARRRDAAETRRDTAARLSAALTVAQSLHIAGLAFVVAPTPTLSGDVVRPIGDRYAAALYRHVDGEPHPWGPYPTRADRLAVLELLIAVHGVERSVVDMAVADDFAIPSRDRLREALADQGVPWGPGPYADRTRDMLHRQSDAVELLLTRYDALVDHVVGQRSRLVLTHGEPHRGNTINTADGVVLIDWDTALLAPPERDLWALLDEDPIIAEEYTRRTGAAVDDNAIQLYRLWWRLCEISLFVDDLRQPHLDTEETRLAFENLKVYLSPDR